MRPDRRRTVRPLAVAAALLALLLPAAPALADPGNPTPSELRRATQRVTAARHRVASLQDRAELAAEALNGATLRAAQAKAASVQAVAAAAASQTRYDGALAAAQAAQSVADAASARAQQAAQAQQQAEALAAAAQQRLDRIAVGAFQTGGQLGMVSQLFLAHDPLELANGRNLMNRVGAYQDEVIAEAVAARARAHRAAVATASAQQTAAASAAQAQHSLDDATAAKHSADTAAATAQHASWLAAAASRAALSARRDALALVAEAQRALGAAVRTKAQLEAAAQAARSDAAKYENIDAPSDQARIAIHWAFEEIGTPYSWGGGDENGPTYGFAQGAGTKGFDCSGLTLFAYGKAGIHLDHYTGSQWNEGKRISSRADLLPGDLMFFAYDTSDESTIHHVAIYIGNDRMIEAPYTGEVVRVASADRDDFIGATRPWA